MGLMDQAAITREAVVGEVGVISVTVEAKINKKRNNSSDRVVFILTFYFFIDLYTTIYLNSIFTINVLL